MIMELLAIISLPDTLLGVFAEGYLISLELESLLSGRSALE